MDTPLTSSPASATTPPLLTVAEAATLLGLSRSLTYQLVMRAELPSLKIGRARRIPPAALETFIQHGVAREEAILNTPPVTATRANQETPPHEAP